MNGFLQTFHNCHFLAIIPALRKIRKEPTRFAGPELTTIHCPGLVAMAMDALGAGWCWGTFESWFCSTFPRAVNMDDESIQHEALYVLFVNRIGTLSVRKNKIDL